MGLLFVEKTVWYGCGSDGRTMGLQFLRSRRMFAVYFRIFPYFTDKETGFLLWRKPVFLP